MKNNIIIAAVIVVTLPLVVADTMILITAMIINDEVMINNRHPNRSLLHLRKILWQHLKRLVSTTTPNHEYHLPHLHLPSIINTPRTKR
eukprot:scaffold38534_cov272-Skeletonema_dohrnii-CCMP3373.AAC.1